MAGGSVTIYILGAGAVGMPLAAFLARSGRSVVAVRTSRHGAARAATEVSVRNGPDTLRVAVETVSLSELTGIDGIVVLAAKCYANRAIAASLREKAARGRLVILQNGVGVERPFLDGPFAEVYRCVLYVSSQAIADNTFAFRSVTSSPLGLVRGEAGDPQGIVGILSTKEFPFHAERNIERQVWKKAIANAVFNSICPLLEVDNGIFVRQDEARELAKTIVTECVTLTDRMGLGLTSTELMEQILLISKRSDGQLISTLQDIRSGRETEIDSLNLEMSRVAASLQPKVDLGRTELLGKMILAKSALQRMGRP